MSVLGRAMFGAGLALLAGIHGFETTIAVGLILLGLMLIGEPK